MESAPAPENCSSGLGSETAAGMGELSGVSAGDDFSIDELLDFSNGHSETEERLEETEQGKEISIISPIFQEREGVSLCKREDFGSLHEGELCVQAEGLESLEWLSHFMEDSFPDYSLIGKSPKKAAVEQQQLCFTTPVQTKARTKRGRAGLRIWPVLSPSLTELSDSPPSSASSTTSFPPPDSSLEIAPAKKKTKPADGGGGAAAHARRCSHCGVTKTPQWRAGPLGSKTLCNACGVRYKSGRLLPEYRPACSPTFSGEVHSNNHRKVLEMRRKKEAEIAATGLPPSVQSF